MDYLFGQDYLSPFKLKYNMKWENALYQYFLCDPEPYMHQYLTEIQNVYIETSFPNVQAYS